ncbi:MAG TPA: hypothetical protein VHC63_06215 [Acidimicrobiales bacterium]|nr:hypothetical protein [Acidimicrobiales bacterium]
MFVASYTFTGDVDELKEGHAKMVELLGMDGAFMHVAVVGDGQLVVLDACPSREVHQQFAGGDFFQSLIAKCGLPQPKIDRLGDVHTYFFEQR